MFTGLITEVGAVRRCSRQQNGLELTIGSSYSDLETGESIAVDGACLTVVRVVGDGTFTVHIVGPSLGRTRFEHYRVGQRVNLERALRAGDRLGGHLVQGHVDGIGSVERVEQRPDARLLDIQVPAEVGRVSVPLGSIAVDGVSLTVAALRERQFDVQIVPYTWQHTAFGTIEIGHTVNLECDMIGKYVARAIEISDRTPK